MTNYTIVVRKGALLDRLKNVHGGCLTFPTKKAAREYMEREPLSGGWRYHAMLRLKEKARFDIFMERAKEVVIMANIAVLVWFVWTVITI